MKKNVPDSLVVPGHADFSLLREIADEIVLRAGGEDSLKQKIPALLRECIDDVILTPKTRRRSYEELEKTEKTYIGTRVEIMLRSILELPRGKLDTVIRGRNVDIKHTMGNNWMIPREALQHPCLLVSADEQRALCYFGIIVARPEYLVSGENRDRKKTVSAKGFKNILWLLKGAPYPQNFWRSVPPDVVKRIFSGKSGNKRVMALFREVQDVRISRDVIAAVAMQDDFMRRVRKDKRTGTRNSLAAENILILNGMYDSQLIQDLSLPCCDRSEFISHRLADDTERELAQKAGHAV
jgi:hypothetical protein